MKIEPHTPGTLHWGAEPVSYKHRQESDEYKADCRAIGKRGRRAHSYGLNSKNLAVTIAADIEKATGVEMRVFSHEYN